MNDSDTIERLDLADDAVRITWSDGHVSTFHFIWLLDNAPEHRHAGGQKLIDPIHLPLDAAPASIELSDTLDIVWQDTGQRSQFSPEWLRAHCYETEEVNRRRSARTPWSVETLRPRLRRHHYPQLCDSDTALRSMLQDVVDFGFAILEDVPIAPNAVLDVVSLFGYVRETNYGKLFDVKVEPNATNLAFTSRTLPGHTDNPYRHPVPTLQLLHYLVNSVEGGDNTLVDGFFVAERLRASDPESFQLLASTPVYYRYNDAQTDLLHECTIIETDARGAVIGLRVNNRSLQPFYSPPERMVAFYRAYQQFGHLLEDDAHKLTIKLTAGDCLVFDNLRILHGRIGYRAGGARHLQGCYADLDSLRSRLAVLNAPHS